MLIICALLIGLTPIPSGNFPTDNDRIRFTEMVMVEETSVSKPKATKTNEIR